MALNSNTSKVWNQCFKSKIKDWGGSKGLLIPNSLNFPKGPVVLIERKNRLEVIFVGHELPLFVDFIKRHIRGVLKDYRGKVLGINNITDAHIKKILIAIEALEQRSAYDAGETGDSEAVRELFQNIAASIKKHLEIFLSSTYLTNRVYHLSRLSDELDYASAVLEKIL